MNVEEDWVINLIRELVDYTERLTIMRDNYRNIFRVLRKKEGDQRADEEMEKMPVDSLDPDDPEHVRKFREFLEKEIPKKTMNKYLDERRLEYRGYNTLRENRERLYKTEKEFLHEAMEEFKNTELWNFCESVKGLGKVAGLTYLGYWKKCLN